MMLSDLEIYFEGSPELDQELQNEFTGSERAVIQAVAMLPQMLSAEPFPTLPFTIQQIIRFSKVGGRRVIKTLHKFDLMGFLTMSPEPAIGRAWDLLERAWPHHFPPRYEVLLPRK